MKRILLLIFIMLISTNCIRAEWCYPFNMIGYAKRERASLEMLQKVRQNDLLSEQNKIIAKMNETLNNIMTKMSYEIELSTGIKRSADIIDLIEMVLWLEKKYKINIDDFDIEEMQKMMKIKE